MFARKSVFSPAGRAKVFATVAALALTAVVPSVAAAAPRTKEVSAAASDATDFSARRRIVRGAGGAAAAAAFAGIVGTGLAIAATQNRRAYYDDYYGYGGPAYGGPVYVAPSPYYGGYGYGPNW
jgi:nicotinic acid phosphoribosyltransferase